MFVSLLLVLLSFFLPARCDYIIQRDDAVFDGRAVLPGDTVCIEAGKREKLVLKNFAGTAAKPITFINFGGQVVISTTERSGIYVQNSQFIHITGTGDSTEEYGIKIVQSTGAGINVSKKSSDFEIDHIEITGTEKAGVFSHTPANCPDGSTNDYDYDGDGQIKGDLDDIVTRNTFTQSNTVLHHNHIYDVGTEGFYIGASGYDKDRYYIKCDGKRIARTDPVLVGVQIFDNRVEDTGWDGIQVGSAIENCNIYDNEIYRDSLKNRANQKSGIMNNPGSVCNIFDNYIKNSTASGIFVQGNGGNRIYNNQVINQGTSGIFVVTGTNSNNSIDIWRNKIINPQEYGVRFYNNVGAENKIQDNIIINAGLAPIHLGRHVIADVSYNRIR